MAIGCVFHFNLIVCYLLWLVLMLGNNHGLPKICHIPDDCMVFDGIDVRGKHTNLSWPAWVFCS